MGFGGGGVGMVGGLEEVRCSMMNAGTARIGYRSAGE